MEEKVYSDKHIELFHDIFADDVYINVIDFFGNNCCTRDYTKEELTIILKDMLKFLEK